MITVVAALIANAEGKLLICQRTALQPFPLCWEFPGGKIEPGEDLRAGLARELEEELGIKAAIGEAVTDFPYHYANGTSVHLHFFAISRYQGEISNRVFQQVQWVPASDLGKYDFLAADLKLVHDLSARRFSAFALR
jgi:8-oxo-dGTP diphosphatase